MRKLLTILLFTGFGACTSFISNTIQAQNMSGDILAGFGFVYGSGALEEAGFNQADLNNNLGLQANGYYSITPVIRIGADFTYYFPQSAAVTFENFNTPQTEIIEVSVTEFNVNGHLLFLNLTDIIIYGLAGINLTKVEQDYTEETEPGLSHTESETGVNLGAGFEYNLHFTAIFGEAKFANLGGEAGQFTTGAGFRFRF